MKPFYLPEELFKDRDVARRAPDNDLTPVKDIPSFSIEIDGEEGAAISCPYILSHLPDEPHILYFLSEYDNKDDILFLQQHILNKGGSFFWLQYREIGPRVSVDKLLHLSERFVDTALKEIKMAQRGGPVVLMGRGLGTGLAIHAFSFMEDELLCLILESAFNDLNSFLNGLNIDGIDSHTDNNANNAVPYDPFLNKEKVRGLKKAILFLHSHGDTIVPLRDIEWLVCESRSKATQFQVVPSLDRWDLSFRGGELYFEVIWQFINLRMGRRPKRRKRRTRKL